MAGLTVLPTAYWPDVFTWPETPFVLYGVLYWPDVKTWPAVRTWPAPAPAVK